MKLYKLECYNEDGAYEENGYFLNYRNAMASKINMDNQPSNLKHNIKQQIKEIRTAD